jgi:Glycosyltransferase family 87
MPAPRWSFPSWARSRPWTILATVILLAHAIPFLLKQHSEWEEVYLRAAGRLIHGGDVYRFEDGYSYPPFMAWLAIPFTLLPPTASRALWFGINVVCLMAMWRMAWRSSGGGRLEGCEATDKKEHLVCFLGLACAARYALNGIAHQQTDLVIGTLLLYGCGALSKNQDRRAAIGFGLATAMKGTALLWCPYLLWRRKWQASVLLLVVSVGVNLLPNLVRPPERGGLWLGEWLTRYVRPLTTANHYPGDWGSWIIYNQSLAGAGNRWLTTQWGWRGSEFEVVRREDAPSTDLVKVAVYSAEILLLIVVGFVLIYRRRRLIQGEQEEHSAKILEYCLVLLLMVLLSPMSSKPHFSTLILPGFLLARIAVYEKDTILRCLLGMAMVVATLSLPLWGGRFDFAALWLGSETWNALVLLLGCVYALAKLDRYQPPTISFKPWISCRISSDDNRPIRFPTR